MSLNVHVTFPRSASAQALVSGAIKIQRYTLRDAISELFELTLEVLSTDPALAEGVIVGEAVDVDFGDELLVKQIRGLVGRMEQLTAVPGGDSKYVWTIVPPLWLTTLRRDHRIFQHLAVTDIVSQVLADATYGGRIADPLLAQPFDATVREYCVQYGETDYEFITRVLADEGIASYFDHTNGSVWTLIDDTSLSAPEIGPPIPFSDPSNLNPILAGKPNAPHVAAVVTQANVATSAVTLRDYDFEKPEFTLEAKKAIASGAAFPNEANLEAYLFEVGRFRLQPPGDARAGKMLEERRSARRTLRCATNFLAPAGIAMTLVDHPRSDVNGALLVVRADVDVTFGGEGRHVLECVEMATPFRPARRTKPRIHGTQTAMVVGAPGEEIDVDPHGRVEVEFRWDRRDLHKGGTSRRVRVSQGAAGLFYGFGMVPRVGEEVIVAYLDGDPDEPVIIGRLHNPALPSPQIFPQQKTVSTWRSRSTPFGNGENEILMDDQAGAERLWISAQLDFRSKTGRNADTIVGVNQTLKVGGSQQVIVGGTQNATIGGDHTSHTNGNMVAQVDGSLVVGAGDIWVGAKELQEKTGNSYRHTEGIYEVIGKTVQVIGSEVVWLYCGASQAILDPGKLTLKVGGSSVEIADGSIKIVSSGPVEINGSPIKLNC